jgi:hypothetical protein
VSLFLELALLYTDWQFAHLLFLHTIIQPISQTLVHRNKDALETMTKKHPMGREPTFINTLSAFLILKGTFKVRRHKQPIKHTRFSTNIQYPI